MEDQPSAVQGNVKVRPSIWGSPTPMHAFAASLSDSMMLSSSDRRPATHRVVGLCTFIVQAINMIA